jgi:tetratricopeptide (TPR) repeat protein
MDFARGPAATTADIIEGWGAVETALRSLVDGGAGSGGGASLAGQALIREARQRQLLSFDQANSLAEFEAAKIRAERGGSPTDADVNAARAGFLKLETALMNDAPAPAGGAPYQSFPSSAPPPLSSRVDAPPVVDMASAGFTRTPSGRQPWLVPVLAVVVLALVGTGIYFSVAAGGGDKTLSEAIQAYQQGRREVAAAGFTKAARENPKDPAPHIYLARMAREVGNMTVANQERQLAIEIDPKDALALREMGSYLLALNNYPLAAKFYVRAIEADSSDKSAMGWLGCTMMRMNRVEEGQRWMMRAGSGQWTVCTPGMPPAGTTPPIPR